MAALEEKLLYGEAAGYCSSSEEEDGPVNVKNVEEDNDHVSSFPPLSGGIRNTGPKGVLDDYRAYTELKRQEQRQSYEKVVASAKRCTLSGPVENVDLEILRNKRIQELRDLVLAKGKIVEITKKEEFLDFIESYPDCWILIHIYDDDNEGCVTLNRVFNSIALRCSGVKLAKVTPSVIGMSSMFKENGLPSLQVYRNETLLGNFVRLTDQLGEQFTAQQLIKFLNDNEVDLEMSEYTVNMEDGHNSYDTEC